MKPTVTLTITSLLSILFLFVWTLIALGATTLFSIILSVRGLWSLRMSHS